MELYSQSVEAELTILCAGGEIYVYNMDYFIII